MLQVYVAQSDLYKIFWNNIIFKQLFIFRSGPTFCPARSGSKIMFAEIISGPMGDKSLHFVCVCGGGGGGCGGVSFEVL